MSINSPQSLYFNYDFQFSLFRDFGTAKCFCYFGDQIFDIFVINSERGLMYFQLNLTFANSLFHQDFVDGFENVANLDFVFAGY